jgi:Icc-related predicted phosphoesterase
MKIVGISDMHGIYEGFTIPKADILCICGDIVPLKYQRNIELSDDWFINDFIPWCCKQPINDVYLVGGNHDFFLQNRDYAINQYLIGTKITYLNNQSAKYTDDVGKVYTIFGSPDCHIFGNWAFMYEPNTELKHFRKIPKNCDILLTHDAAYGENDVILQDVPWNKHKHIGNPELTAVLDELRDEGCAPKLHLTAHLHSTEHNLTDYNGIKTACVSLLDEHYKLTYKPFVVEWSSIVENQ